jgi:hypothetical protein
MLSNANRFHGTPRLFRHAAGLFRLVAEFPVRPSGFLGRADKLLGLPSGLFRLAAELPGRPAESFRLLSEASRRASELPRQGKICKKPLFSHNLEKFT